MGPTEQAGTPPGSAARPRWSEVLRALREARGVTLDGWSARIGVSRKTVQRWERGERVPDPGAEATLLAYCREVGLFRPYDRGPLAGLGLTADLLQDLLAEARWRVGTAPADAAPSSDRSAITRTDGTLHTGALTSPSNLPAPLTSFVGREREIADVRRLQAGTRLLTLTGPGGVGKTRLALQIAAELLWAYPHGVWLVELAALAGPALVPQTVAAAFGLQPTGVRPPVEDVTEFLRSRHLLLVLDNCEHVLTACAHLADALLRASPTLEVLATSREPLGVAGETVWRVPPMAVPSSGFRVPSESHPDSELGTRNSELEQADSVRLFVERARLHRPEFELTPRNAEAVAAVCRRLDGIPLAIELAAARVKVLSPDQLAARLGDRFQLLTGGGRTALPRHQTLRAAMDWSHDLLTAPEQALLRRLSVFAGGFTLEAAEVVGGAMGNRQSAMGEEDPAHPIAHCPLPIAPEHDVLDLLSSLVDKSLVMAEEQNGAVRHRLLETVRQYAAEKLDAAGEVANLRDRHLDWCLTLAQMAEKEVRGPREPEWLAQLEAEHDNLRAALAWSLAGVPGRSPDRRGLGNRTALRSSGGSGGAAPDRRGLGDRTGSPIQEKALRLAAALLRFWELRGHMSEGRQWLTQALEAGQGASAQARATALHSAGVLAYMQGDYPVSRALHEQSLALSQKIGNRRGIAEAQCSLGYLAVRHSEHTAARAFLEASLAIHTELEQKPGIAGARDALGVLALRQGDYDAARAHFEAAVALHRELGNSEGLASALEDLASVAADQDDGGRQAALLEESLTLYREIGNRQGIALVLGSLGVMAWTRGDHGRARALAQESLALYREVGDRRGVARLLAQQGLVALYERDYAQAVVLGREGIELYHELGEAWAIGRYLPVLAGVAFAQGHPKRAARLFGAAAALRERLGTPLPPAVRGDHDRTVTAVRTTLGDEAFEAAWTAGSVMPAEQTVAYALADAMPA